MVSTLPGIGMMVAAAAWVNAMGMAAPALDRPTRQALRVFLASGAMVGATKYNAHGNRDSITVTITEDMFSEDKRKSHTLTVSADEIKTFLGEN